MARNWRGVCGARRHSYVVLGNDESNEFFTEGLLDGRSTSVDKCPALNVGHDFRGSAANMNTFYSRFFASTTTTTTTAASASSESNMPNEQVKFQSQFDDSRPDN